MGRMKDLIEEKLIKNLEPIDLKILDDSQNHKGHLGETSGGESHFSVTIVSKKFSGLNRVERQRLVNSILAEELAGPVHAFSMKTLSPEEV